MPWPLWQGADRVAVDRDAEQPLNPYAAVPSFEVEDGAAPRDDDVVGRDGQQPCTYTTNGWTVVRVHRGPGELDVVIFSGRARVLVTTGLLGLGVLAAYWAATRLLPLALGASLCYAAAAAAWAALAGGAALCKLLQLWLAAFSLERLAVSGPAARLETVHPWPAGALLRRAGAGRSLDIHHGGSLRAKVGP